MDAHVLKGAHVYMCMWRTEVNLGHLYLDVIYLDFVLRQRLSLNLKLGDGESGYPHINSLPVLGLQVGTTMSS